MKNSSSFNQHFSTTELLNTNSLTLEQIKARLSLIKELLEQGKISFSIEEEKKLEKLIDKSGFLNDNDQDETQDFEKLILKKLDLMDPKSEKYLTSDELKKLSRISYNSINDKESIDPEKWSLTRESRSTIRSSADEKKLKEIIIEKTHIQIDNINQCTLKYPDIDEKKSKNITHFEFLIKFDNDKAYFIFKKTFKESNEELMQPEDHLYPEEIQIAMFQKLAESNPEILERIKSAKKINCIQSTVINDQSLFQISRYLDLKEKNPNDPELKKILSSTPNQSNTQNFINQLNHVFGIEISDSSPPKVTTLLSMKQTFVPKNTKEI